MKNFVIQPYGVSTRFFMDREEYKRAFKRATGETDDDYMAGVTFVDDDGTALIGVFDGHLQTAVHEASHLAFAILRVRAIDVYESSGEEAYCYLVDHIFAELQKHMVKQFCKTSTAKPAKEKAHG